MKKLALAMACLFAVGVAQADDKGGFSQDAAPPPPHKLDDGYRGVEDGRIMTVEQAKTMHDGATVSLRGNLLKRQGDDRYQFRDKSGTITVIIPVAAFNEQHVEPDDLVNINGSLDRKMTPPVVRIDRLLKQSPKIALYRGHTAPADRWLRTSDAPPARQECRPGIHTADFPYATVP